MKWQPIETAPKDGTIIIACGKDVFDEWWIIRERGDYLAVTEPGWRGKPTHWLEGFEFPDTKGTP